MFVNFKNRPRLYQFGVRYPLQVLLLSILVTVVSALGAERLNIVDNLTSLLPPDNANIANLKNLKRDFGGSGALMITVQSSDPLVTRKFSDAFVSSLEKIPSVIYVDYHHPVQFFESRQWLYLDLKDLHAIEKRVDAALLLEKKGVSDTFNSLMDFGEENNRPHLDFDDIFKKYEKKSGFTLSEFTSGDEGRLMILRVKSRTNPEDLDASRAFLGQIKNVEKQVKAENRDILVSIGYTGDYETPVEQIDTTKKEVALVSLIVSALLFLILILYFKRWSAFLLIGLPLSLSIIWTGGLVYLILGHLNIITGFGAAILAGLGSDYGIFLLTRFYHEKEEGADFETACRLAFANTGRATYASMITTVGAFVALLFSDFGLFFEFGVVGAMGLLSSYVAMMVILPSLLTLSEKLTKRSPYLSQKNLISIKTLKMPTFKVFKTIFDPSKMPLLGIFVGLILCGLAAGSLPVESMIQFDDGHMDSQKLHASQVYQKVDQVIGASLNPTVLVIKGFQEQKKLLSHLQDIMDHNASLAFNNVVGLSNFIPNQEQEKKTMLKKISEKYGRLHLVSKSKKDLVYKSLHQSITAKTINAQNLPIEVTRNFRSASDPNIFAIYLFPSFNRGTSFAMKKYHDEIMGWLQSIPLPFYAADSSFIESDIIRLIEKEAPKGFLLIILFFTAVLLVMIRPSGQSLILLAHLLGSLIILSGALWICRIPLNILNIGMVPIILGTGIDCFIHLNHRFLECDDLNLILKSEIPAMMTSSLTSIVGFGGLILVPSPGIRSAGWVAVLGLSIVTLLAIFVYPRALLLTSKKKSSVLIPLTSEECG